jgi:hypothetical protein
VSPLAKISKAKVTFRLTGDTLDPQRVTQRLEIAPSRAYARGERSGTRGGRDWYWRAGLWALRSTMPEGSELEDHLQALLDQLEPRAQIIRDFLAEGCAADFFCGLFLDHLNEGVELSPQILGRVAALGATLGLDIYGLSEDGDDERAEPTRSSSP